MYDDLSRTESSYGCVAEYNRCVQEMEEHEYELLEKRNEKYKRNKEKIKEAIETGKPIFYYDECYEHGCEKCKFGDGDTQTFDEDDVNLYICNCTEKRPCGYTVKEKFEVGDKFEITSIFTGGSHSYIVDSIKNGKMKCSAIYEEIDGTHNVKEDFEIFFDGKKQMEYIVIWRYKGEEGRLYAREVI